MQFIRGISNLKSPDQECVLTLGNFDGIHLGHQNILRNLKEQANLRKLPSAVLFFEPQPREFFSRDSSPARLSSFWEKFSFIRDLGIDILCCLRFSQELASMDPADFIETILIRGLKVRHLIVGDDFCFGKDRQGNFQLLQDYSRRTGLFTLEKTPSYTLDGLRISSTLVRQALSANNLTLAYRLLGRPYSISGKVVHGQQLGRSLGFPTANLQLKRIVCPVKGVYAVLVHLKNRIYQGIANVGSRPTVRGVTPLLEVYIFDFNEAIYEERIQVSFLHRLRNEQHFATVAHLKSQLILDKKSAREYFSSCTSEILSISQ